MHGVLNLNKPSGITSYDVIRRLKRMLGPKPPALGHAGTLDPLASGVLVVLVGEATKVSRFLLTSDKEYEAGVRFGARTDTDDITGRTVEEKEVPSMNSDDLAALLENFTGEISQRPPVYSALKRGGQPLHRLARRGEAVEPEARTVTVHELELLDWTPPEARLRAKVSSGTYIRALARDIGAAAGSCATLSALTRTRSGGFALDDAVTLDELDRDSVAETLVPIEDALNGMARLDLDSGEALRLLQGQRVPQPGTPDHDFAIATTGDGSFLAIVSSVDETIRTVRVIRSEQR